MDRQRSRYHLYGRLVILCALVLAVSLAVSSVRIIQGGKRFTQRLLDEHRILALSALGFGHGVMVHMGASNYDDFIRLALECRSIRYVGILDELGRLIRESKPPRGLTRTGDMDLDRLKDGAVLEKKEGLLLVAYRARVPEMRIGMMMHHTMPEGGGMAASRPAWFLVGLDTSGFLRHYRDMLVQTLGTAGIVFILGVLIVVFLVLVQRYELAHASLENLLQIKRLLSHFVPRTARNLIENDSQSRGLLGKYIEDATILFLDIENFTLLLTRYSQERVNRAIERYFSLFLERIEQHGGDVNETAGDGMMVIFLAEDRALHAANALRAAREIRAVSLDVKKNPDLFPIRVNMGINTGQVHLGSTRMGGLEGERWTFTASGMVTVKAARLAAHARGGQILVGEETARRIEDLFSLTPIGRVPLKNIEDSGIVYEAAGPIPEELEAASHEP